MTKTKTCKPVWIAMEMMDDPILVAMGSSEWVKKFKAAIKGEKNEFSPYIRFAPPEPPDTIAGETN